MTSLLRRIIFVCRSLRKFRLDSDKTLYVRCRCCPSFEMINFWGAPPLVRGGGSPGGTKLSIGLRCSRAVKFKKHELFQLYAMLAVHWMQDKWLTDMSDQYQILGTQNWNQANDMSDDPNRRSRALNFVYMGSLRADSIWSTATIRCS